MIRVVLLSSCLFLTTSALANWEHSVVEDEMGRGSDEVASVISSNSISLKAPYDGVQHGEFSLRRLKNGQNEFVLAIEKGQIICDQDACGVLVRPDNEKPFLLVGKHPKDGSSDAIAGVLGTEDLRKIKKAQKLRMEITIYQNGESILEFETKDNPFVGAKSYLITEINDMVKNGNLPKVTRVTGMSMDMPDFNICKKVANLPAKDDQIKVVELNKKDEFVVATYFESSLIKQQCKKGSVKSEFSFYNYD
ncbi:hypothetical protein [Rahnella woolbedingensis]|uniref:Uncharacterized protein n=1 Tax=Rahnella woolbedingensis TaxID=1510574 RepID=A0A419NEV0_9GAMM|nr:hypothetical protein [Rahnella woolbedingensis]RJT47247.1 hypothetical protein D6C13_02470 [Rahnella woolbedingensis]